MSEQFIESQNVYEPFTSWIRIQTARIEKRKKPRGSNLGLPDRTPVPYRPRHRRLSKSESVKVFNSITYIYKYLIYIYGLYPNNFL